VGASDMLLAKHLIESEVSMPRPRQETC
jgi:hypothetical protein